MNKLSFETRLKNKIDENNKKRNELENNKDKYRKQLRDKLIKDIEESILGKVPKYIEEKEFSIEGPIFLIKKNGNKCYIDYYYKEPELFFKEINDIEEFLEEIVDHFEKGLKYELDKYETEFLGRIGSIKFKYEYKES